MSMIQERMIARTSNTTRLVDKLLKDYVTRKSLSWKQKKNRSINNTKGLDILTQLDPKLIQHHGSFAKNLTNEEQQQLNTLLEKYRNQ
jgi:hypothetical protein